MPAPKKYPDELRERAVRLVFESKRPIAHVATDLGVHKEALRSWVRQPERDAGGRQDGLTSAERDAQPAQVPPASAVATGTSVARVVRTAIFKVLRRMTRPPLVVGSDSPSVRAAEAVYYRQRSPERRLPRCVVGLAGSPTPPWPQQLHAR